MTVAGDAEALFGGLPRLAGSGVMVVGYGVKLVCLREGADITATGDDAATIGNRQRACAGCDREAVQACDRGDAKPERLRLVNLAIVASFDDYLSVCAGNDKHSSESEKEAEVFHGS